jgi:hypothetical protein
MEKTVTIPYALLLELYESQVYDAYYNPQTIYGPGRPEALEFIAKMNEFVAEQDQYEEE